MRGTNKCKVKFVCELEVVSILNPARMTQGIPFSIQCDTGESNIRKIHRKTCL